MTEIAIEQVLLSRSGGVCRFLGRSAGYQNEWQAEVERLAAGFGDRPAGVACPEAVFARPLGKNHVAIVKVADQEGDASALGYHFLIVPCHAYRSLWGDPFVLAERVSPAWHMRGEIPTLSWPAEPLPGRTVEDVRKVLQQTKSAALPEDAEAPPVADNRENEPAEAALSPALLGGVQVLVDGGRLVFERSGPDPGLMRGLWTLLPTSTRCQVWPASFAFGNALGFDALVLPPGASVGGARYTTEDQACEYPQGRYELNLQIAAEAGNQAELDGLLGRRSSAETMRLGLVLLVAVGLLAIAVNWFQPAPKPARPKLTLEQRRSAHLSSMVGMASPWEALSLFHARADLWEELFKEKP